MPIVAYRGKILLESVEESISPPTFAGMGYALHPRFIAGQKIDCVLLDSVASQANRMEKTLGGVVPDIGVQFGEEFYSRRLSTLEMPHRVFDAILRDSEDQGVRFGETEIGKEILDAEPHHAAALLKYSPATLLFGGWNSDTFKQSRAAKFSRCLTAEIVGVDAVVGVRAGVRADPLNIMANVGIKKGESDWDFGKGNKPSEINHGSAPWDSRSDGKGGVTVREIHLNVAISVGTIRKLRFGTEEQTIAGQTLVEQLALYVVAAQSDEGYTLRSGCSLFPVSGSLKPINSSISSTNVPMAKDVRLKALEEALEKARALGIGWDPDFEWTLNPTEKLRGLVVKSKSLEV